MLYGFPTLAIGVALVYILPILPFSEPEQVKIASETTTLQPQDTNQENISSVEMLDTASHDTVAPSQPEQLPYKRTTPQPPQQDTKSINNDQADTIVADTQPEPAAAMMMTTEPTSADIMLSKEQTP